jgi:hypothetical protein
MTIGHFSNNRSIDLLKLTLSIGLVTVMVVSTNVGTAFASGPRFDWNGEYDVIPGGPQCWIDGYDAGLETSIDLDRVKECEFDVGNPYLDAWMGACEYGAGNSKETCESLAGSAGYATTDVYGNGYDHGCDDAGIAVPSDKYINQPGKGPSFHTNEFMDGYDDGFNECSGKGYLGEARGINPNGNYSDNHLGNGNVTLGAECGIRLLIDDQLFQPLSEHQCFFFNSCKNLGGSIPGCYAGARIINCDIESGKGYYCPPVLMNSK